MENGLNFLAILRESFTLVILLFCSFLSGTFIIERWWYFRKASSKNEDILSAAKKLIEANKFQEAETLCQGNPSVLARLIYYAIVNCNHSRQDLGELLGTKRQEERLKLERFLGILGTLGNIAPFIGLFGTVVGIIKAFRDLALSGSGGPAVVAKGIAEALVSTAAGLMVAIPAVIAYNYFMRRIKYISVQMEIASTRLMVILGSK
jgi:biopolymer transport protein ExbB/TolQ